MGGWVGTPTIFSKKGVLRESQFLEGVAGKEGLTFFKGGCSFSINNQLKSDIFNDKKAYIKIFFSVIIKNLHVSVREIGNIMSCFSHSIMHYWS